MKKQLFACMLMLLGAGTVMVSCSNDNDSETTQARMVDFTVKLSLPIDLQSPTLNSATAVLTNVQTGKDYTVTDFKAAATKADAAGTYNYEAAVEVPEGSYNVKITGDVTYLVDGTETHTTVQAESNGVTVNAASSTSKAITLENYTAKEGMVIDEIFFTGTQTPEGKQYQGDQYIKITNNSDQTVYADSLAIVESAFNASLKYDYNPDIMDQAIAVEAIYMIPGNGKEHPVEPGKSLILALNAKNHKTDGNANSFDLSKSDFEFYDESTNPKFADTDNPDVPNLDKWFCYTLTYFVLNGAGNSSYALVRLNNTNKEDFLKNYTYEPTYTMTLPTGSKEMTMKNRFKIPNAWVVDAVNLGTQEKHLWNVFGATLDTGWTWAATSLTDKTRYNKAVVRKRDSNGKLVDTNNSTNDFEIQAPSLNK